MAAPRKPRATAAQTTTGKTLFYAPAGSPPIPVDLPNGERAIVSRTPRELPKKFWSAARRAGCFATEQGVIEQLLAAAPETPAEDDYEKRREVLVTLLDEASNQADDAPGYEGAFLDINEELYPNAEWLEQRAGFKPSEAEIVQAWSIVKQRISAAEEKIQD